MKHLLDLRNDLESSFLKANLFIEGLSSYRNYPDNDPNLLVHNSDITQLKL